MAHPILSAYVYVTHPRCNVVQTRYDIGLMCYCLFYCIIIIILQVRQSDKLLADIVVGNIPICRAMQQYTELSGSPIRLRARYAPSSYSTLGPSSLRALSLKPVVVDAVLCDCSDAIRLLGCGRPRRNTGNCRFS